MLAWEVFELCENLKHLLDLSSASQHEGSLEAHQAMGSFACWRGYIVDQAVSYQRSIQVILSKRDLSCPEGLE